MFKDILRIARKELAGLFSSPTAYIFLGAFLGVTLFTFFWVDTFFARNIADVRPLFEWMPLLLIFLMSAVTMRMWSEERRMGTMEYLMALPVSTTRLVLGKFLACWSLALVALALTVPLAVTVAFLGPLDPGPVLGGYMAAIVLASAYAAIGLMVSSRTDSQIVSLIVSSLIGGLFYVLGSGLLTAFVGNKGSEFLKLLSTGARFESITRGVLDFRDLYYYASLTAAFLAFNVHSLETLRWSRETVNRRPHRTAQVLTALLCANVLTANLWLDRVNVLRIDMTSGNIYSISPATRGVLAQLREPLVIRGYFSAKTHPLLSPLVPRLRDLIKEYENAAPGRVRGEFIDPMEKPELEKEAGEKYGIKPVPFQVSDKYQSSLVNSYFNILILYGDQYEVLGFDDLIEVKQRSETDLDVELRNPEYDLTRSIKKVLQSYQGGADLFSTLPAPVTFHGYLSPERDLPPILVDFRAAMVGVLDEMKKDAGDKLSVVYQDPRSGDGALAQDLAKKYGFQPMRANLFDPRLFYFSMLLTSGDKAVPVPLPKELTATAFRQSLDAALKRFSVGFLKTVALSAPAPEPMSPYDRFGGGAPRGKTFELLKDKLSQNHAVLSVDLKDGRVPDEADLLIVAAPKAFDDKQVFAMDQFLMKGGTVILLASPYAARLNPLGTAPQSTGLTEWLDHHGITLRSEMVLDPQNTPFPIPIERRVGMFVFQEMKMVNYPYFIDVRGAGLTRSGVTAGIPQVTLHWASPLDVNEEKNKARTVTALLTSSPRSWTSGSMSIVPDFVLYGDQGFPASETVGSQRLGVSVEGRFNSFFAGKPSPLLPAEDKPAKNAPIRPESLAGVIDASVDSARLLVVGSSEFLTDDILRFSGSMGGTAYVNSLQLAENMVDWSLEDRGLLTIRGRGHFARLLRPMAKRTRVFWEYANYGFALAGLFGVWALVRARRRRSLARIPLIISEGRA